MAYNRTFAQNPLYARLSILAQKQVKLDQNLSANAELSH